MSEADDLYREGVEAFRRGEDERSRELNVQSLSRARAAGDAAAVVKASMGLARLALRAGDLDRVHALVTEARAQAPVGAVEFEQANLGWVEINEGNLDAAEELIRGSLAGALGESAYGRAFGAIALARCAAERGDGDRARELLAEANGELADAGLVLDPSDRPEYAKTVELAKA